MSACAQSALCLLKAGALETYSLGGVTDPIRTPAFALLPRMLHDCVSASQHLSLCVHGQSTLQSSIYRLLAVTASPRVVKRRLAVSILV